MEPAMQKQYFSHIRRQFVNVTGVLLASSIAIPAPQRKAVSPQRKIQSPLSACMPVIRFSRKTVKAAFRPCRQCTKGRGSRWKAMSSASSRKSGTPSAIQPEPSKFVFRRKSGTGSTSMRRIWCG